jgi:hypothetical protein
MTTAPTPLTRRDAPDRVTHILLAVLVTLVATGVVLLARHDSSTSSSTMRGSGIPATQARSVPRFTGVELSGSNRVTVHVGDSRAVVVRGDDNLLKLVTTNVRAGTLVVGTRGSFSTRSPMSVDVTTPSLASASLTGSGIVSIDGVRARAFAVDVTGSGVLRASGTASRLDAHLGGSADVQLGSLVAREVTARLTGAGRLQVHATRTLDASVTGVGAIVYTGNPASVTKSVSGTGAIAER